MAGNRKNMASGRNKAPERLMQERAGGQQPQKQELKQAGTRAETGDRYELETGRRPTDQLYGGRSEGPVQVGTQYPMTGDFQYVSDILQREEPKYPGREGVIGQKEIDAAFQRLLQDKADLSAYKNRIRENQEYFEMCNTSGRLRNREKSKNYQRSSSGFLFNSIANKHADFMDNYPEPAILPREESDQSVAKMLTSILPCIHEQNDFERTYSENSYDKLIGGTCAYAIAWNGQKLNGLGDIEVKPADLMNLYWESGVEDIQKSKDLFYVRMEDTELLEQQYPFLRGRIGGVNEFADTRYVYETQIDTSRYTTVVEWYYKKPVLVQNGIGETMTKQVLHYCKFVPGKLIFATENEPAEYPNGWYEHGLYPFVFDTLFPLKGSPAGFGYVDVIKSPQEYIDKLDTVIEENAELKALPRYFVPAGAGVNANDFKDKSKRLLTYTGNIDGLKPVETPDLPAASINVRTLKVDELKEVSGNRDFSQGTTSGGVTAASAIAALQEAGSKLSRDMIKSSYNAYKNIIFQEIELIRQFYNTQRAFRITEPNERYSFLTFDNRGMQTGQQVNEFGQVLSGRTPYFDIRISAQKASPYARITQNELAKELYSAGMFNPQLADQALICIGMMDFDGKDEVLQKINMNYTLYMQNMQLQAQVGQLAQAAAAMTGDPQTAALAQAVAQQGAEGQQIPTSGKQIGGTVETDSIGNSRATGNPKADRTKQATAERAEAR